MAIKREGERVIEKDGKNEGLREFNDEISGGGVRGCHQVTPDSIFGCWVRALRLTGMTKDRPLPEPPPTSDGEDITMCSSTHNSIEKCWVHLIGWYRVSTCMTTLPICGTRVSYLPTWDDRAACRPV